jgi:hypothetical protein
MAALCAVYALATTIGPTASTKFNDLYVYSVYAHALRDGLVPYRDFPFEYPPLALAPIGIAGGSALTLALLMLAALLVAQWCAAAIAGPSAAWLVAASPLLTGALVRTHFDALPAAIVAGALLAFVRDRPRWGFALLAVGAMTKLYPVLIVPVAAAWLVSRGRRRDAAQGVAIAAAICAIVLLPFAGQGLVDTVRFHLDRPVQIESAPAMVSMALGGVQVTGDPVIHDRFKSNGVTGGHTYAVELLFVTLLALALVGTVVLAARGADLIGCSLLAVLAFVCLGKVLSPQYMVWLVPLAALAWCRGYRVAAALTAAGIAATQLEFPDRYFDLVYRDTTAITFVVVRDALLLAAAVTLAAALARSRRPGAAASSEPRPR